LNEYPAPPSPRDIVVSPTVRPPMDVTASLANGVILNATPGRVEVGQKVRFELRFRRPPPPDLNIQYGFNFADSSPIEWTAVPRTTHPYSSLGTYDPSVEIRVGARVLDLPKIFGPTVQVVTRSSPTPTNTATSAPITPSPTPYTPSPTALPTATPINPLPEVYLSVDKNPISAGDSVTFSISTSLPARNPPYSYSVDFGDGSQPSVITTNSVLHIFKTAGHYTASVTVLDDGSHERADLAILVDARRPPWLWVYILVGLAAVALAYLVYQRAKSKIPIAARPTFYLHSDWDAPQKPPKNVAINYGLYFHSNVSAGQDRLETDGASSILKKKKP
jgi:PKD domain